MHYIGIAGVPRRLYSFDNFGAFSHFDGINQFITITTIVVFILQLVFVINFFYSIWRGRKMTTRNPYGATTLEWTTPIHTGHGNWPGKLPSVHRWPYDLSKGDRDFIPQIEPLNEGEADGGGH